MKCITSEVKIACRLLQRLLALCLALSFSVRTVCAQDPGPVTLNMHNASVEKILDELKSRYGLSFVMRTDGIDLERKVSVDVRNEPLSSVLERIFSSQGIMVEINNNVIRLSRQENPVSTAAPYSVRGRVTDVNGDGVPGASVFEKGTSNGTTTDLDGNWTLEIKEKGQVMLECACLGYDSVEKEVSPKMGGGIVNFVLRESSEFIDEVVVVGYGTMKRSLVTSAISKVKIDEDKMRPVTSPAELLNGRIAGVTSSTGSGNLGSGERISIRGASSISAGNEPLYVIDGIPITNSNANLTDMGEDLSSLSVLNLSDIESIEILKDAASAAIYGSRATNGVVVITTKSGKEGASNVNVNFSTGVSQFPNIHKIRMADSDLYIEVFNEGVDNYNRQYGLTPGDADYKEHIYNPFGNLPDTDWMKLITQLGVFYNADVAFSGGNRKSNYYIGANYNHKEGVIKTNKLEKMNFKVKLNHEFTPWLEVGVNTSANYMKNWKIPGANAGTMIVGRAILQRPFDRPYKPDGSYYVGGTDELTFHNPMQILNEETAYLENLRFLGSYYVNLKFWDDRISFKNSLNTDITQFYDYTNYNENHPYGKGVGRIVDRNQTVKNILLESVLNYSDSFLDEDALSLNVMLGHSFQNVGTHNATLDGSGFPSPSFDVIGVASAIDDYSGNLYNYTMESYFGRVNLSYKDRYVLTATLRTDGSSKFAPEYRWGWFPSVSFGWNISNESFMENSGTDLKFRLSYGKTGNQEGIGTFAYQAQMAGGMNYNEQSGIYVTEFGNDALTWEKADQFDAGFDMSFLDDRLTVIIDGYLKNTRDLLYSMPIHGTTGTTSIISNVGSMRNIGAELTLGTSLDLGPVHWTSQFNISTNRNRITSLPGDGSPISIGSNRALQVGKEMGVFYLFKHNGIFQYDSEVPAEQYAQGRRAGDIRWLDVDNNGIINDDDRVVMGSSNPDFFGGWSNTFSWRGLSLDIFFTYMYGNDVYSAQEPNMSKLSHRDGLQYDHAVNRWTGPGTTNVWPRALNGDNNNTRNSDFFLHDGSFIRLRTLTLSYRFPTNIARKIYMKGLRIYGQVDNLFLITRYPGYDPEVSSNMDPRFFGVDDLNVPQPRTFTFGLNVTF